MVLLGIAGYGVSLVAAIDAFRIARRYRTHFDGPWYTRWQGLLVILALAKAIGFSSVFLVRAYIVEPFRMPSQSMMPTFFVGDFIAAYKWPYGNPGSNGIWLTDGAPPSEAVRPQRGDIVLFRFPNDPDIVYIKRIVGLPGDVVFYRDRELYVNGEHAHRKFVDSMEAGDGNAVFEVHEEALAGRTYQIQMLATRKRDEQGVETKVPAGHYFVMGDNRDYSNDSRYWGFVPATHIIGRPAVIWFSFYDGVRADRIGMRPR